jgi:hypothetical protein
MAGPGVSAAEIRAGQEAMARRPAAAAGSIEAGVVGDLRDGAVQAGLEKAAMISPSFTGIRSLEDSNVGHRDNQNNIMRSANEIALNNTALARINLLEDFVNNGFVNMGANRVTILNEVTDSILGSSEMASRFAALPAVAARQEALRMAAEYLTDPNFRGTVIDLVMRRADLTHPIADQVTEVAVKLEDLRADRLRITQVGGEQPVAVTNETNAQTRLNRYLEDPGGVAANNGQFYTEIIQHTTARDAARNNATNLETNTIPGHEATLQQYRNQEQDIREIRNTYVPRNHLNPNYDPNNQQPGVNQYLTVDEYMAGIGLPTMQQLRQNITTEEGSLRQARINLVTEKNNVTREENRITQLNEERSKAEQALKDAQQKKKEIDDRVTKLDKDINEQAGKYNRLQTEKELQETKWVTELDNIIRDATAVRLHEELPLAVQKIKERMDKRAAEEKDNNKRAFLSYKSLQYIGPDGRPNRAIINTDRTTLMNRTINIPFNTANGPQTLLLNGAEQTLAIVMGRSGMTPDQIYNLLKDPTTRAEMSGTLAQDILTTHLWAGGRLSRGEIVAIHQSEWGKGMVAKAIAGRADIQAQIDASIGKGVLNWNENLLAQLGKVDWAKFAIILLIIAGIIGGVGLLKK